MFEELEKELAEQMAGQIDALVEQTVLSVEKTIDRMSNSDFCTKIATFARKQYDAFIEVGFDQEVALTLVTNSLKNMGRQ